MEMDKLAQQTFSSCSNSIIIPFLKKKTIFPFNWDLLVVSQMENLHEHNGFFDLKCLNFGLSEYGDHNITEPQYSCLL